MFDGLNNLDVSFLNSNPLKNLQCDSFSRLVQLKSLSVNNCSITGKSNAPLLMGLEKLESLRLSSNRMTHLYPSTFSKLKGLRSLYVKNNSIKGIARGAFALLSNLTTLNLGSNEITVLNSGDFVGLKSLAKLILLDNSLHTIEDFAFEGLSKLKLLYLNMNNLTAINRQMFTGLQQLRYLNLDNNPLTSIDEQSFSRLSKLTRLKIKRSKMECTCTYVVTLLTFNKRTTMAECTQSSEKMDFTSVNFSHERLEWYPWKRLWNCEKEYRMKIRHEHNNSDYDQIFVRAKPCSSPSVFFAHQVTLTPRIQNEKCFLINVKLLAGQNVTTGKDEYSNGGKQLDYKWIVLLVLMFIVILSSENHLTA